MEVLRVENLCKVYGKGETRVEALKNVSFSMEKGEFAAVVGESGSGKSTLFTLYRRVGATFLRTRLPGWPGSVCTARKPAHDLPAAKHRVYFSILPAGGGINSGAEYRLPPSCWMDANQMRHVWRSFYGSWD